MPGQDADTGPTGCPDGHPGCRDGTDTAVRHRVSLLSKLPCAVQLIALVGGVPIAWTGRPASFRNESVRDHNQHGRQEQRPDAYANGYRQGTPLPA